MRFQQCMTITKDGGSKYTSLCPVRKPDIFTRFENPQTQISDVVKCVVLSHAYLSPATPGGVHIVPVMHQGNPWVFCGSYAGQVGPQNECTGDVAPDIDFEIRFLKKTCIFRSWISFQDSIWRAHIGRTKNPSENPFVWSTKYLEMNFQLHWMKTRFGRTD